MQVTPENRRLVKFIFAAVIFFAWSSIQGAVMATKPVYDFLQLGGPAAMIRGAHSHIALLGWTSLALMAAVYYLVPILSGKPIAWQRLINWIFWVFVGALAVSGAILIIAGIIGGSAVAAGMKAAQVCAIVAPYAMINSILGMIGAAVVTLFVIQILFTLIRGSKATG